MSGLHRARASSAHHQETFFGERFAQEGDLAEHRVRTQKGVSAHYPNTLSGVASFQKAVKSLADGMVVQGPPFGLLPGDGMLAGVDVVPVHLGIVALAEGGFIGRVVPGVEFFDAVQGFACGGIGGLVPGGGLWLAVVGRGHGILFCEVQI